MTVQLLCRTVLYQMRQAVPEFNFRKTVFIYFDFLNENFNVLAVKSSFFNYQVNYLQGILKFLFGIVMIAF